MASTPRQLSSLTRSLASSFLLPTRPNPSILPSICSVQQQVRELRTKPKKVDIAKAKRKRKPYFRSYDTKDLIQFSLCDAMRYIRAFEAGQPVKSVKYEVHLRLRTKRDGPVIRNQLRLPHAVHDAGRVCVICPPGSRAERDAKAAGADIIGEEDVFESIKAEKIDFDICICHSSSFQKLTKAGLGRILGPKGLMPSTKTGTVVDGVGGAVRNLRSGSFYRERLGVIRIAVGQLGFSPDELRKNLSAFIKQVKKDAAALSEQGSKEVAEVVLSSTHSPGFSLSGEFRTEDSVPTQALTGP